MAGFNNGNILGGNINGWLPNYNVKLTRNAPQTIPDATWTFMQWNSEAFNNIGTAFHDPITNNDEINILVDGQYRFVPNIPWQAGGSGNSYKMTGIYVNGALADTCQRFFGEQSAANGIIYPGWSELDLTAGDIVKIAVFHNLGAPLDVSFFGSPDFIIPSCSIQLISV